MLTRPSVPVSSEVAPVGSWVGGEAAVLRASHVDAGPRRGADRAPGPAGPRLRTARRPASGSSGAAGPAPARGLLAGRFQPFHRGHLHALRVALGEVDELVVAIASPDANYTADDPFTIGERLEMIWSTLTGGERSRCLLVPVPNQANNRLWPAHVCTYVPDFSATYTNNPLQATLMADAGIEVRRIPFLDRGRYRACVVRDLLSIGDVRWRSLVPGPSAAVLTAIGAQRRLARLRSSPARPCPCGEVAVG